MSPTLRLTRSRFQPSVDDLTSAEDPTQAGKLIEDPRYKDVAAPDLSGKIITILVGAAEDPLYVHESALKASSAFFSAALGSQWLEGQEGSVKLPEEELAYVNAYVQYIYTRKVCMANLWGRAAWSKAGEYLHLAALYTLGERLGDPIFQDHIIDSLVSEVQLGVKGAILPGSDTLELVYGNTMPGDPVRNLFVDMHAVHCSEMWFTKDENFGVTDFVEDLAKTLLKEKVTGTQTKLIDEKMGTCQYHHHDSKTLCTVSRKRKRA